jgi:hypothetical protein
MNEGGTRAGWSANAGRIADIPVGSLFPNRCRLESLRYGRQECLRYAFS